MKLEKVDRVPGRTKVQYSKLDELLKEFIGMETAIVRIDSDSSGYKNPESCRNSLKKAARNGGYSINLYVRGRYVYLERFDI